MGPVAALKVSVLIACLVKLSVAAPLNGSRTTATPNAGNDRANEEEAIPNPTKSRSKTTWAEEFVVMKDKPELCEIFTEENLHEFINVAEDEENVNLFEFSISLKNYTQNPLRNATGLFFKPWLWYTTRSTHGRTLLMLSFHYDVLSMNILTIGVKEIDVEVVDSPTGCFGRLSTESQVKYIRMLLLNRNDDRQSSSYGKSARWVLASNREEFACNQEILDKGGGAEFVYNCCFKEPDGKVVCSTEGEDFWINILYFAITSVKILMFLFCPKFLPSNVYSAAYVASTYVVNLKKKIKMKLLISDKSDVAVRYKHRLTLEDMAEWCEFRKFLDKVVEEDNDKDKIVPIKMTDLKLKVKGKRIIPENDPPTGLLRTIYDNILRCKIRNLDPFIECCSTSIFADMGCQRQITWYTFVQTFMKCLMLILVPFPYYIRLFIYFKFEADELGQRRRALARNELEESFNFYKTNVIQYFTPFHGIFVATYILYFLTGLFLGFTAESFRDQLKEVARSALTDQNAVSQTGVLGIIIRVLLYPFKRYGLLGFLIGPFYMVLILPLCAIVFALYCIPTVYLSFRLPYHARKLMGTKARREAKEKRLRLLRLAKMKKVGKQFSKMDKFAHRGDMASKSQDSCIPDNWDCDAAKTLAVQVFSSVVCLCILYSIALVFAESIGLFVEVMAFTMMGIIVNAGSVLKYVSMALLVVVYMNDCYSNVYENYLTFNKTIIDEIIERTTTDLRKIASMPSSQQENTAFVVKCVDEDKEMIPTLNSKNKGYRWRMGQLLLFLDCFDTPRIPLKLFQKLCQVRVHGAPGPVYINLLAATGKFMIIVIFLMFVMIVVMAFGNVYAMSSTNTTLATLAGGFVPMLLKNVLSSKGAKLSLKTVSFKGQIDEIIGEYKQNWPVVDLLAERYVEGEDDEEEGEGEDGKKEDGKGNGGEKKENGSGDGEKKSGDAKKDDAKNADDKKTDGEKVKKSEKEVSWDRKEGGADQNQSDAMRKTSKDGINKEDDGKNNGNLALLQHRPSIFPEEPEVDLFIDLSMADAGGWTLYGSEESLNSTMMRERLGRLEENEMQEVGLMPAYFDPNKIVIENETSPVSIHHNIRDDRPPAYRRDDVHVTFHTPTDR